MLDQPTQGPVPLAYRPDVDGLRALAVLLVVFDHMDLGIAGGYIGVDVFFVISGYLISSVILREMAFGRFSIADFYDRRVRRIFPALLVMLVGTACLTSAYALPSDLVAFARSMLAALYSVSNFLFWSQAGYFDTPSALKPLLHTWSLGVEEQFYVFFPLFLVGVRRWFPDRLRITIWSTALLTFTLACIAVRRDPATAFYLAPLRAWELLLGTLISQRYVPRIVGKGPRNLAATIGLLLILAPALLYTDRTLFPGLSALPPCVGTALIIASGENGPSLVGRLLAWRPVVFIGLISYSLYLWHWPILVFLKQTYVLSPLSSRPFRLGILGAMLLMATLSWLYVERPIRTGRLRPGRGALFRATGIAVVALSLAGWMLVASEGFSSRFPSAAVDMDRRYANYDSSKAFRKNVCFIDPITNPASSFADFNKETCLAIDPTRRQYLLMGDSHAAALHPGLSVVFPELNISQATSAACKPFLTQPLPGKAYCVSMWKYIYDDYLRRHRVDVVLISGRWEEADLPALGDTVSWLQRRAIRTVLLGPVPEFVVSLPRLLTLSLVYPRLVMVDRQRSLATVQLDRKLALIAREQWKIPYISAYENLCSRVGTAKTISPTESLGCPVYAAPGVPLFFDTDHFTPDGSVLYARTMRARKQLP